MVPRYGLKARQLPPSLSVFLILITTALNYDFIKVKGFRRLDMKNNIYI